MVSAALAAPGIRLQVAELLALREGLPQPVRHRPATRRPGAVPARAPGAGMDLREIRGFVEGDDARRIDPAATARTGTPHIRSFHEDRDDTLLLIADFRPPMLWGTGATLRSVRAARLLVRWGWQAAARGASLAAMSLDASGLASVPLGGGVPQMGRISHMLASRHDRALAAGADAPSLSEAILRAMRLAPLGAEVLIASGTDGIAPQDEPALARLARRRKVRLLLPLDPLETAPPGRALPVRAGTQHRLARLQPFDPAALARRLRVLNVSLEAIGHDAG
ncbi:DUF58 domain-containing protein [Ancylobacter sp. MQZ15Z-1]|uniref:DUF58 domain-containing protein n=1 Tax=Ancylobacter mangrovi TaxID=2972472 RepID=A0A9X2PBF2_9HYPH|nr:DUF58 domain-containing protein [Ancylobacter mangrovi]MCS0495614.1 DUF58 domain-containing protein [Ancylobacter mangrovi]